LKINKVRRAAAVRSAEARKRQARLRQGKESTRPIMLVPVGVKDIPDCTGSGAGLEMVYMPVLKCRAQVAAEACLKASRAKGAAAVNIPTWRQAQLSEPACLKVRS
jgi:hypothetical protein